MPDAEGELARLRGLLSIQTEISAASRDPHAVMDVVVERARELTGADGAVIELLEGDEMVYRAVSGSAVGSLGMRLNAATSLSGLCVRANHPLVCSDAETDERVDRDACRRVGVSSMVVVPLVDAEICQGVLKVLSGVPEAFGTDAVATLEFMAGFIAQSFRQATEFQETLERSLRDGLTGLANRAVVLDRLSVALARKARSGAPLSLLFCDLDGFKAVNDTLGHAAGDHVLVEVAKRFTRAARAKDTVGRLGGDEFVVVCEEADAEVADLVMHRLVASLDGLSVGVSIGIATHEVGETGEALLARADQAMYVRKAAQRL